MKTLVGNPFNFKALHLVAFTWLALTASACGPVDDDGTPQNSAPGGSVAKSASCKMQDPLDTTTTADGYTLVSSHLTEGGVGEILLVDMEGKTVNSWKLHGFPAQMLPGGEVIGVNRYRDDSLQQYQEGIQIEQHNWEGKKTWSYSGWDADGTDTVMSRQHHDLVLSPNPVGYWAPGQQASAGSEVLILGHKTRKVSRVSDQPINDDVIYEIRQDGGLTGTPWYAADHIDEMGFDAEDLAAIRKNANSAKAAGPVDWLHLNAMARLGRNRWYEEDGDTRFHPRNIIVSSRMANIIFIIDHKSGRIVWRLGPDYSKGSPAHHIGQLVGQHHAHMIPHGLPGAGNILVFDNGGMAGYGNDQAIRTFSRVLEFNPVTLKIVWEYNPNGDGEKFFCLFIGSAQRLPNGNTLINDGLAGRLVEVDRQGKRVWTYQTPSDKDGNPRYVYRAYRVPPEWLPAGVNPAGYKPWSQTYDCPR